MTTPLAPGKKTDRLPDGITVFRLVEVSKDGAVPLDAFELSTEDKASELKSISVWAELLTTPEQARDFFGDDKLRYQVAAFLPVNDIRGFRPTPESEAVDSLDVVWDPLTVEEGNGKQVRDRRLGADGHSGITGLARKEGLPDAKKIYKSLRSQLVDLANKNLQPIEGGA